MKAWLSRLFSKKPKPKLNPTRCIECGADTLTIHPPGTPVIHLGCETRRLERAKDEAKAEADRRVLGHDCVVSMRIHINKGGGLWIPHVWMTPKPKASDPQFIRNFRSMFRLPKRSICIIWWRWDVWIDL